MQPEELIYNITLSAAKFAKMDAHESASYGLLLGLLIYEADRTFADKLLSTMEGGSDEELRVKHSLEQLIAKWREELDTEGLTF